MSKGPVSDIVANSREEGAPDFGEALCGVASMTVNIPFGGRDEAAFLEAAEPGDADSEPVGDRADPHATRVGFLGSPLRVRDNFGLPLSSAADRGRGAGPACGRPASYRSPPHFGTGRHGPRAD